MKVDELRPKPTNRVLFKHSSFKLIPPLNGCYILTTFDCDILYVGLATNLNNRFHQHLDNPGKTSLTPVGKAIWFYFETYDPKNLPKLERTWLNQYVNIHGQLPLLNKLNSPVS